MVKKSKWALGSNQYVNRAGTQHSDHTHPEPELSIAQSLRDGDDRLRYEDTGITWEPFDVDQIPASEIERSRHRFRDSLPELIWNTAALEGNTFTLVEVRTLLEGVTVGGKKVEDEKQIIALNEAFNRLDEMVGDGTFALTKEVSDELHKLIAVHEAIESGIFRGEGQVNGGGTVSLSNGGSVPGTEHGVGGQFLREHFDNLVAYLATESDARRRALIYNASATRRQFYFDGNKRTARLMMAGELMSNGYDVVSISFNRRLEYNKALDRLFEFDDATSLLQFLGTCRLPDR